MKTMKNIQWKPEDSWIATLVSLLPIWLLSLVILAPAVLQYSIAAGLAASIVAFVIAVGFALLWKGWLEIDLLIYSLSPLLLFFVFGEVYLTYRVPFIVVCVFLLSAGMVLAERVSKARDSLTARWLILFVVALVTWVLASHVVQNYWQMLSDLGYGAPPLECMPNAQDCPLSGNATAWWVLFFNP